MNECDVCLESFFQLVEEKDKLKVENSNLRNKIRDLNNKNMIVKKTFYNATMTSENPYAGSTGEYSLTYIFTGDLEDLQKVTKIFDKLLDR